MLPSKDKHIHAEERRLFYVALTRAKETVRIVKPKKYFSTFAKEILNFEKIKQFGLEEDFQSIECPICGGNMQLKKNPSGKQFWGCENYPICKHTVETSALLDQRCPICNDYLIERVASSRSFIGCNSFNKHGKPYNKQCKYSRNIDVQSIYSEFNELDDVNEEETLTQKIGRASCRERV